MLSKSDEEIDFSDSPELTAADFALAPAFAPHSAAETDPGETQIAASTPTGSPLSVTLEVEPEVLAWFRAQGEQSHHKMRAALRIYAQAHQ